MKNHSKWTVYLGRVSGIKIYIHWTFLILIIYLIVYNRMQGQGFQEIAWSVGFILSVFLCVTLHELGHALVAKRYGCITRDIMLLPIGGLARMERLPEEPKQEMAVAIAGPLVNVVIAFILYIVIRNGTGLPRFHELNRITDETFILNLFLANVLLFAFNLIPAFPMDGGRVLRALLSFRYPRHVATRIAATVGQLIAIVFVLTGLFSNPFLVFIGVFIFLGAQIESDYYQSRYLLKSFTVRDVLMHHFPVVDAGDSLEKAVHELLDVQGTCFLVTEGGLPVGTLNRKTIIQALKEKSNTVPLRDIMNRDIRQLDIRTPLEQAYQDMHQQSSELVPVMENGKLAGVVDLENVMEFILVREALLKK